MSNVYYNVLDIIDLTMKYDDSSSQDEIGIFHDEIRKIVAWQKETNYQYDEIEAKMLTNFILEENCFEKAISFLYAALSNNRNEFLKIVSNKMDKKIVSLIKKHYPQNIG